LLELRDVSFRYDKAERIVLHNITLDFSATECVALMGPSGSGKSTLLSIVGSLVKPTSGSFRDTGNLQSSKSLSASWIFQANTMIPRRTARDNVALSAVCNGQTWAEARRAADAQLAALGLAHRGHAAIEELSGGEVQRTAVARAFLQPASIVLADEPTAQLDSVNARHITAALKGLSRTGRVVLLATHDDDVAAMCDRTIRMKDGRIISDTRAAGEVA
jgi:ABC-type lipoprotein export system ATPase subunit